MIFVIDIGNTTATLAGLRNGQVQFSCKVETNREWNAERYTAELRSLLPPKDPCRGAILSSVVPQITMALAEAVHTLWGIFPIIVDADTDFGLIVDLPEPEKVGRDRLVDAVWAAENMTLPAVTADLGTATTLNVILPGNIFAGGIICAGVQTGLRALAYRAAQLPRLELRKPDHVIGKSTEECMIAGAVAGTAAMLDGLVLDIEQELGTEVSLAITGGGGQFVEGLVRHPHLYDRDLTLKGLALVFEKNS